MQLSTFKTFPKVKRPKIPIEYFNRTFLFIPIIAIKISVDCAKKIFVLFKSPFRLLALLCSKGVYV